MVGKRKTEWNIQMHPLMARIQKARRHKLVSAKRWLAGKPKAPPIDNTQLMWMKPIMVTSTIGEWKKWRSACERYAAVLVERNGKTWFAAEYKIDGRLDTVNQKGSSKPVQFTSLRDALEALKSLHLGKYRLREVKSNIRRISRQYSN